MRRPLMASNRSGERHLPSDGSHGPNPGLAPFFLKRESYRGSNLFLLSHWY